MTWVTPSSVQKVCSKTQLSELRPRPPPSSAQPLNLTVGCTHQSLTSWHLGDSSNAISSEKTAACSSVKAEEASAKLGKVQAWPEGGGACGTVSCPTCTMPSHAEPPVLTPVYWKALRVLLGVCSICSPSTHTFWRQQEGSGCQKMKGRQYGGRALPGLLLCSNRVR